MSEAVGAITNPPFDGAVRVEAAGPRGMITLKGDLSNPALQSVSTDLAGVDSPAQGAANFHGEMGLCWMAPDELLILLPRADVSAVLDRLSSDLIGKHHLAADVSDARTLFTVGGAAARDVLGKLTPADLSPRAMNVGICRRTRLAQVPAAFWMRDETTFEVVVFRSVAQYVFDLLTTSADPHAVVDFHP